MRTIKFRAWDYTFNSGQKKHQKVWKMFLKAGYKPTDLSVFMLVNWKIPYEDCLKKLDLLKIWNVKVNDCCFDGGYPKSEVDFNTNKRFNNKRFWEYRYIKKFRSKCRKHNQMVLFKIDPEVKKGIETFIYLLNYLLTMKTIHIYLEDKEYDTLKKRKGELSWHDFVMQLREVKK